MTVHYRIRKGYPWTPPDLPKELFDDLATALTALGPGLEETLAELRADDVETALNSLEMRDRLAVMRGLRFQKMAPRRVGRALSEQVLLRLQRLELATDQRHGASHLTERIWRDVLAEVLPGDGLSTAVPTMVARWNDTLLRLAFFSQLGVSALDARVVLWAAGRGWFGWKAEEAALESARLAAQRLLDAATELGWSPGQNEDGDANNGVDAVISETIVPEASEEGQAAAPAEPLMAEGASLASPSSPTREVDSGELASLYRQLAAAVQQAQECADRVSSVLADGARPEPADLGTIEAVFPVFERMRQALAAVGAPPVPDRLTEIADAVESHRATAQRDDTTRASLHVLLTLTCLPGSPAASALDGVISGARELLARPMWDEAEKEEARALALVSEIVRIRDEYGSEALILDLQQRLAHALPALAAVAVLHRQILVAAAPETAAEPDPQGPPSGETGGESGIDTAQSLTAAAMEAEPIRDATTSDAYDAEHSAADQSTDESAVANRPASDEPVAVFEGATVETDTTSDHPIEDATREVEPALGRLVTERRFGLAARLSAAAGRPASEAAIFRLAAHAGALRTPSDNAAVAVVEELRSADVAAGADTDGAPLLFMAALVRTALVTGDVVVGAQLKDLAHRLPGALAEMATHVAETTLTTALLMAPPSAVVADVSENEERLRAAVDLCSSLLIPPRMRFSRATQMAKGWLKPTGALGSVLTAIVDGSPSAPARAERLVDQLGRRNEIESLIDQQDAEFRGTGGRVIQGAGRNDVRHLVERVRAGIQGWRIALQDTGASRTEENAWAFDAVASLRNNMLELRGRVVRDLNAAGRRAAPLTAAAAVAARYILDAVFNELEQGRRPGGAGFEGDVADLLDVELYKVRTTSDQDLALDDYLRAVDLSWDHAVSFQVKGDGFTAVRTIARLAEQGLLPAAESLHLSADRLSQLESEERKQSEARHQQAAKLTTELGRAQAEGALTVEQDIQLQGLLADAEPRTDEDQPREPAVIRRNLDRVAQLLPRYREEAAGRLQAKLDDLRDVGQADRNRVRRFLDTDNLATAAELIYFLELGEKVPEIRSQETHLEVFFPTVPDALPDGITEDLIAAVRDRAQHAGLPALDYSGLSTQEAERVAAALEGWLKLSGTKDRNNISVRSDLNPALSLLGFEAPRARPLDDLPRGKDYRFFELSELQVTGRAWAPAFGSQIMENGRKLRALLIWGRPPAKLVLSRILQSPGESSLLVVHFGTLDAKNRAELACSPQGGKPVMVVDDAALAYLAAHGNRRVDAATETLLAFSEVNPYIKEKRGRIGYEMFYGRDRERKSILDPDGTQILYGGRGLGKSALLADAGDRFEEQRPGVYRKLYVNLDKIGISRGTALGAAAIWPTLEQELTRVGVLEPRRRRDAQLEAWEYVTHGVAGWLAENQERRLLVLLDECDRFFEADAPECTETRRLRGLGGDSAHGRAKVVFAGLHSVQRFTRIARNGPFSHLAQTPTVVGPLTPQFAADLIVQPMSALGFEFADVDLVNRVLGFCSYQPFLLQIFGSRMVQIMQERRSRQPGSRPPYAIETADVEAVERDNSLRSDIKAAFKDTLDLDDRYRVIADVLAEHARDHGLESRLSDRELREECTGWWSQGFGDLDSESFRAYLEEMVGLGVLAPNQDGRGWHLRGPNALRMIGTAQDIDNRLWNAERECRLEETVFLENRPVLSDHRSAPLTRNQIDYLLGGGGNQVRVVLGTRATGIEDVERTLRDEIGRVAGWTMPAIGRGRVFRTELVAGRAGERRLLISDLTTKTAKACRESLDQATTDVPAAEETTRSVVLVSGVGQIGFWRDLLADVSADLRDLAVPLRRYDRRGMRDWTQQHTLFATDERLDRLTATTGGWPFLLYKVTELYREHENQDRALRGLEQWLNQPTGAEELVNAVGLLENDELHAAYTALVEHLGLAWNPEDDYRAALELADFASDGVPALVACLEAMQVLDRDGARLRIEPVLHSALTVFGMHK
ncbi:hypothetical protein [Actinacidiphila glaucinigra]|uniref:hypothetical protein n=1 Tax=Actinacidiphila glaucinigra TaxID=235986 RepID=UPI002E30D942|nr:hypothetical protein [Actinacidiphila glaucinigra]